MESSMRHAMIVALFMALTVPVLAVPATALAQPQPSEPPATEQASENGSAEASTHNTFVKGKLDTLPRDERFGQRSSSLDDRFSSPDAGLAAVDRRRQITTLADRNILVPMAQTPAAGTVSYSNFNILGNYLTYAPTDKLALTAGMVIPGADGDFVTSLSGKYKLYESRDWHVSVLPFGAYSNGVMKVDTYQFGLGAGLLSDFYVTDSIVLTGGALGFATLAAGYDSYSDNCTRSEFIGENCAVETTGVTLPSGGHWIAATLGANWFLTEQFALNIEYILAGSWGTFFGVEDTSEGNDLDARRDRFENPEFAGGLPHGTGPLFSVAGTWSNGTMGLQLALVMKRSSDDPDTFVTDESQEYSPLPMLSGAVHF
jgi:hypothetical protein